MQRKEWRQHLSSKNLGVKMYNLERDIDNALKYYPSLRRSSIAGRICLEGKFTASEQQTGVIVDTYDVRIIIIPGYPARFPVVEEISRKIPLSMDRHVNGNGFLCFANPLDELKVCQKGITMKWFLANILNSHLCREFVREAEGKYPTGERSHGTEGLWESYYELLGTTEKAEVLNELQTMLYHPKVGRNAECYCDSGKKYKRCHEIKENEVFIIGKSMSIKFYNALKEDFKNENS